MQLHNTLKLFRMSKRPISKLIAINTSFGGLTVRKIGKVSGEDGFYVYVYLTDAAGEEFVWNVVQRTLRHNNVHGTPVLDSDPDFAHEWRGDLGSKVS